MDAEQLSEDSLRSVVSFVGENGDMVLILGGFPLLEECQSRGRKAREETWLETLRHAIVYNISV